MHFVKLYKVLSIARALLLFPERKRSLLSDFCFDFRNADQIEWSFSLVIRNLLIQVRVKFVNMNFS